MKMLFRQLLAIVGFLMIGAFSFSDSHENATPNNITAVQFGRDPAVGYIKISETEGVRSCFVFMISYNTLVTANHCVPSGAFRYVLWFLRPHQMAVEARLGHLNIIERDLETDIAIGIFGVQVPAEFYPVSLSTERPDKIGRLGIPVLDRGTMRIRYETCEFKLKWREAGDLLYHCQVPPGTSGAPIFDMDTGMVVGMHYSRDRSGNFSRGVESREMIANSKILRDERYGIPDGCFEVSRIGRVLCD